MKERERRRWKRVRWRCVRERVDPPNQGEDPTLREVPFGTSAEIRNLEHDP